MKKKFWIYISAVIFMIILVPTIPAVEYQEVVKTHQQAMVDQLMDIGITELPIAMSENTIQQMTTILTGKTPPFIQCIGLMMKLILFIVKLILKSIVAIINLIVSGTIGIIVKIFTLILKTVGFLVSLVITMMKVTIGSIVKIIQFISRIIGFIKTIIGMISKLCKSTIQLFFNILAKILEIIIALLTPRGILQ